MTVALAQQRIRISLDPYAHAGLTCRLQDTAPRIWRGTDVLVEIGLYMDGVFVDATTDIDSITCDVLASSDRAGTVLLRKTILAAALGTCSEAEWTGNTAAKYLGRFEWSKAETQFDMTAASEDVLTLWMVFYATMSDGREITLGAGQLQVEEDGAGTGMAVGGTWGNTRISPTTGLTQIYVRGTGKWHTIVDTYIDGVAGFGLDQTGED
jgi:hypothetical protein